MSYTNTWNESIPLGSSPANTADDWLRQEKLDMRERLNSILGVAIGTALSDPITPAGTDLATLRSQLTTGQANITTLQVLQAVQSFKLDISWTDAQISVAAGTLALPARTVGAITCTQASQTSMNLFWSIVLPVGVTITNVGLNINGSGNTTTTFDIYKRLKTATSLTSVAAYSATDATGIRTSSPTAFAEVTIVDTYYTVQATITPQAGNTTDVYGIEVLYTSPTANTRI